MDCPTCGLAIDVVGCPRCGAASAERTEWRVRAAALPLALLFAWLAVTIAPGAVRLLSMWVHESGHAATAWICGYIAVPGPWFTPIGAERSPWFSVVLLGLVAYAGYRAWQAERGFWIAAAAGGMLLILSCTLLLSRATAQQLILFAGDGGSLVLGTLLMLTMYAREGHPVRREHLRWAFLVIGALAFMDAYVVWTGPINHLPLGENENGLSDPSMLTQGYGWNLVSLITRYQQLAHACMAVLAAVYLVSLYVATPTD